MKFALFALASALAVRAQSSGYIGYSLSEAGPTGSAVYATANTPANVSTTVPPPDVYLNASVSVGEIDIDVKNLTAQVNLAAQVLSLLQFNAGVDVSIDEVYLTIQNVSAKVVLEARLENLVHMIDDVLHSLDLNPALATLGQGLGNVTNATATTTAVSSASSASSPTGGVAARSDPEAFKLLFNILYSINDYSGNTHTNRILAQNGDVVDQLLDNNGNVQANKVIGTYKSLMQFNGYNVTTVWKGQPVQEVEYVYQPIPGVEAISAIYQDISGQVVGTQVLAESNAGGSSTVSD